MPMLLMLMPMSLSLPAGVIAYGFRNCSPPLKRLLAHSNTNNLHHYHHLRRRNNTIPPQLNTLISFNFFPRNLNCLLTGSLDLKSQPIAISDVEVNHEKIFPLKISAPCYLPKRFWSGSSINKNKALVEHLQNYGTISSKKVSEVMETIDRALFVPDGTPAYVDSPMAIGYNATISAPHMHATCLQLLEENLKSGMHVLDVGSGTGYLTACFALMVGPQGRAVGVEHIPELADSSIKNIKKSAAAPLLKEGSLSIHVGDGRQGWPEFAPYDAIHVGAAAPEIPQPLLDQLKPGGRMVIPVGNIFQDLKVIDKNEDGSISVRSETSVRYVPLTSKDAQLRGY
ncbi:protein-L-isoaspartate O-methyltransferase 1-like isoform X1 [Populus alba x Populus x berolinensis]|uniref:protein-L-isoaspartate(D-aspartate) O-methyltransferase n=2 Tax=Populus TaxID=3689 RepID=A0AAD6M516_9ROSI|nr:protein-L-isoaspartate O-methyltransferase 1-like isoform X1 [Populus alba x Populus x berolinensis]